MTDILSELSEDINCTSCGVAHPLGKHQSDRALNPEGFAEAMKAYAFITEPNNFALQRALGAYLKASRCEMPVIAHQLEYAFPDIPLNRLSDIIEYFRPYLREPKREHGEFETLRTANVERQKEWDKGGHMTLSYMGNELAGETGELCNVVKKLERETFGMPGSRATVEQAAEEAADVIICVDLLANRLGFKLWPAVKAKFNKTSEKNGLTTKIEGQPS